MKRGSFKDNSLKAVKIKWECFCLVSCAEKVLEQPYISKFVYFTYPFTACTMITTSWLNSGRSWILILLCTVFLQAMSPVLKLTATIFLSLEHWHFGCALKFSLLCFEDEVWQKPSLSTEKELC